MDPQHRLFLECAWEALENAGYEPRAATGGRSASTPARHEHLPPEQPALEPGDLANGRRLSDDASGNDKDFLATRVSYKLNLRGPSVDVQTACSTSLVAVHLACQSLLAASATWRWPAASSITVPQRAGYLYQEGSILSPDGHCRAFDAEARGTVAGSGVGIVVLKRLAEPLADGDHDPRGDPRRRPINNDGAVQGRLHRARASTGRPR